MQHTKQELVLLAGMLHMWGNSVSETAEALGISWRTAKKYTAMPLPASVESETAWHMAQKAIQNDQDEIAKLTARIDETKKFIQQYDWKPIKERQAKVPEEIQACLGL
jgi:hypothetical protein